MKCFWLGVRCEVRAFFFSNETNGTNRVFGYTIQKKRKDYSFRRVT